MRSYRCVCAVAEATGVEFRVFHRMCRQVNLQTGRICVTAVTIVTFVWLVLIVLSSMRLEKKKEKKKQSELINNTYKSVYMRK